LIVIDSKASLLFWQPVIVLLYLFIMVSYTTYKYSNRTQNARKMKKKLKTHLNGS